MERLPNLLPLVSMSLRVCEAPAAARHRTDVPDIQKVRSVLDDEIRALWLLAEEAMAPMMVSAKLPVDAKFCRDELLANTKSYERLEEDVPDMRPAVITTRRVPRAPCPT